MITKNRALPRNFDIKGDMSKKRFKKGENDFCHVLTKSCPSPPKVNIKKDMSENNFFIQMIFVMCSQKLVFLRLKLILRTI